MTQFLNSTGQQRQSFAQWDITKSYELGDLVTKDNRIYRAVDAVPAGTPFEINVFGPAWQQVAQGHDTKPTVLIPEQGFGWGRIHAYGNKIFRAGSGNETNPRVYAFGLPTQSGTSMEYPCEDSLPDSWVKIQDTGGNFYGLGMVDGVGVLYGGCSNVTGQLGDGTNTNTVVMKILGKTPGQAPTIYGPGITVLNFWTYDQSTVVNESQNAAVYVNVDDNGSLKTYSFGLNNDGQLGVGDKVDKRVPTLAAALNGKRLVAGSVMIWTAIFVTSTGEVWGAGYNGNGYLGLGNAGDSSQDQPTFARAKLDATNFVTDAVDVGIAWANNNGVTTFILLSTGRVLGAGTGNNGRLGDGNNANHQNNYFAEVKTGPTTPLTNITKIQPTYGQLMALDAAGNVWFTSANWGAMWGNGEPINETSNGYAVVKQSGVANIWTFPRPRGYLAAFYLLTDGTLWASGQNTDFQLGVASSGETNVLNKERVVIPRDEYPVAMKGLGIVSDTDVAYIGCMMLTNKDNLYVWGSPGGSIQSIFSAPVLRWPHRLTDFYYNQQTN
jgi:alpha-tubulin suppressor-like RCC1 family protein